MNAITGNYRDGHVILDEQADWPPDTKVRVEPVSESIGLRDDEWPNTPEAIEEWIKWYDSLEPFLTPEEEAKWHAALEEQKEYEKAHFEEHARKLEKLWE